MSDSEIRDLLKLGRYHEYRGFTRTAEMLCPHCERSFASWPPARKGVITCPACGKWFAFFQKHFGRWLIVSTFRPATEQEQKGGSE